MTSYEDLLASLREVVGDHLFLNFVSSFLLGFIILKLILPGYFSGLSIFEKVIYPASIGLWTFAPLVIYLTFFSNKPDFSEDAEWLLLFRLIGPILSTDAYMKGSIAVLLMPLILLQDIFNTSISESLHVSSTCLVYATFIGLFLYSIMLFRKTLGTHESILDSLREELDDNQ